jgi:hypothetical protein
LWLFLPAMKRRRKGAFVFVTSARETRPEPGFAVPTTLRAATTAFAIDASKRTARAVAGPASLVNAETPTTRPPMAQKICRQVSDGTAFAGDAVNEGITGDRGKPNFR